MAVIQIIICLFVFLVGLYHLYAGYKKLEAAKTLKNDLDENEFSREIFRFEVLGFLRVITGLLFIVFAHAFI
jgi:hypothetical protein